MVNASLYDTPVGDAGMIEMETSIPVNLLVSTIAASADGENEDSNNPLQLVSPKAVELNSDIVTIGRATTGSAAQHYICLQQTMVIQIINMLML